MVRRQVVVEGRVVEELGGMPPGHVGLLVGQVMDNWLKCACMHIGGLVISASPSPVQLTPQRDYVCLRVPTPPAPATEEAGPTGGRGKGCVDLAVLSELEDWWLLEHARQASLQCLSPSPPLP